LEFDIELDWHGFELHPGTPKGGLPLTALFPGTNLKSMHERTKRFAAQFGVSGFEPPDRLQSSRRALAIAEYAREQGKLEAYRRAVFDAHWRHARNLELDADLAEIAREVGLPADNALAAADDPAYLSRVDEKQAEARAQGVTGIPTFFFDKYRVVGCQPFEVLADAAERMGAVRR